MIKLSRSGWNNVIIFSIMGFILLINATHKNVFTSKEEQSGEQFVLGADAVILTLRINNELSIERVGRNWRATPERISGQALTQMMRSWQQLEGQVVNEPDGVDLKLALVIEVEVADSLEIINVSLIATDYELLMFNHVTKLWFSLPLELYSQLFPDAVFS
ncbi:hypothetical protein [Thalassotalea profundi]|uniref:Uncharacterized protein n=1 Tax=Thalassotalea profundi TaxID=2036687 RepID=A0ABQ3IX81_9GAMM|nr:hypothetical protein [Thalassotalea profundi]GHE97124.1 hypothetical protein GCM10011501_28320 [Thalassotalea profundi]